MTAAEEKVTRGVAHLGILNVELRVATLNFEQMEEWKKRVMDTDKKDAGAVSEAAEVKDKLGKVADKRNEF